MHYHILDSGDADLAVAATKTEAKRIARQAWLDMRDWAEPPPRLKDFVVVKSQDWCEQPTLCNPP